jgi:hypothetical protein
VATQHGNLRYERSWWEEELENKMLGIFEHKKDDVIGKIKLSL